MLSNWEMIFLVVESSVGSYMQNCSSFYAGKLSTGLDKSKSRGLIVRASNQSGEEISPIAPFQLESPAGQLLTQIL